MAAPSFNISGYLDVISDADDGTGWIPTDVDTDIKVEGVAAGYDAIRNGGTVAFTFPASVDMSGTDIHIRQWIMHTFPSYLKTKANGGIQLYIGDASNTAYWYVGGSDTHNGAWQLFQADLSVTPDSGTLPTLTAITKFGFVLDHATAARNVANTYWDIATFAKGYEVYGGTTSDKVSWETLAIADTGSTASVQYGITELIKGGAYYLNSGLWLGDGVSTNDCYFDGTGQTVIFYAADEKTGLYKIIGSGNSTGTTDIDLSGSVLKSASSAFILDMSGANVTTFTMDGAKVENASASSFKSGQSIQGTVFAGCGTISHNGSTFDRCTVVLSGLITVTSSGTFKDNTIDKPTGAVGVALTALSNVTGNDFISDGTGHAVDLGTISSTQAMAWDNTDSGYAATNGTTGNETILVSVDTGITLTLNVATGASTPTIKNDGAGDVTVVEGAVEIDVNVKDAAGDPVPSAFVYIDEDLEAAGNITNTTTDSNGDITTASYSGAATTATLRIRLYGYKPILRTISLLTDSVTNITFNEDPQQSSLIPAFSGTIADMSATVDVAMDTYDASTHFTNNPTSYGLTNEPTGMVINSSGIVSGTMTTIAETTGIYVTATNSEGDGTSNTFAMDVLADSGYTLIYDLATYDPVTYLVGDEIVSGTPTFVHTSTILEMCSDGYYHTFGEDKRVVKNGRYVSDSAIYADNGSGTLLDPLPMTVYQDARTSLFEYTDGLESNWTTGRVIISDNDATSPENATTGHSVIASTDTGRHTVWQTQESLDGTDVVVSCFAKANGYDFIVLRGNQLGADQEVWFNLNTGAVVGTVPTGYTANIVDVDNGWYRCIAAVTVTNTGTIYTTFCTAETLNTSSFTGDDASGMWVWAPMLETDQTEVGLPMINTSSGSVATDEIINTYPSANWSNSEGPIYLIHDYKGIDEVILLNDDAAILYVTSDVLYLDDGTNTASIAYSVEGEHEIGIVLDTSGNKMKLNIDGTYSIEANYDNSFGTGDIKIEADVHSYRSADETSYTAQQTILDGWMP